MRRAAVTSTGQLASSVLTLFDDEAPWEEEQHARRGRGETTGVALSRREERKGEEEEEVVDEQEASESAHERGGEEEDGWQLEERQQHNEEEDQDDDDADAADADADAADADGDYLDGVGGLSAVEEFERRERQLVGLSTQGGDTSRGQQWQASQPAAAAAAARGVRFRSPVAHSLTTPDKPVPPQRARGSTGGRGRRTLLLGDGEPPEAGSAVSAASAHRVGEDVLRQKLGELSAEVERFRAETLSLRRVRAEQERELELLRGDGAQQRARVEAARVEFERWREVEMRRLRDERLALERRVRTLQSVPDRRERGELESLRAALEQAREEARQREERHRLAEARLQRQLAALSRENAELREDLRRAEQQRLEEWARREQPALSREQHRERRHQPPPPPLQQQLPPRPPPQQEQQQPPTPSRPEQQHLPDGSRVLVFADGARKHVFPDGYSKVLFPNGDVKERFPDRRVVYLYAAAGVTHESHPDGLEVLRFGAQQTERHFPDGRKEIAFADGTVQLLLPNGDETTFFPDGTLKRIVDGKETLERASAPRAPLRA